MAVSGCQSIIGMFDTEACGDEVVPGTIYCLDHGTVPTAVEYVDKP